MYWLTGFGSITLPQYNAEHTVGIAPAEDMFVSLPGGGVFDVYGSSVARQRYPYTQGYRCAIYNPYAAAARAEINALKALIGTRAKLWRTEAGAAIPDQHWCWARLIDVNDSMSSPQPQWVLPITLAFSITSSWRGAMHGDEWNFDTGEFFDDGLAFDQEEITTLTAGANTITLNNGGNMPVREIAILIDAGDAAITDLILGVSGISEFDYSERVGINALAIIDCKNKSVRRNTVDSWAYFALTANHKIADWLVLQPGNNTITVTMTGGGTGSTIEFVYSDCWA